jgi:hypothetical protein
VWWFARRVSLVAAVVLCAGGLPLFAASRAQRLGCPTPGTLTPLTEVHEGSIVVPQEEASDLAAIAPSV